VPEVQAWAELVLHMPSAALQPAEPHDDDSVHTPPLHEYDAAPWHSKAPDAQFCAGLQPPVPALQPADPHELASTHASLTHWYEFPPWHSSADPEHAGG
jgi:hypothetical protein